jgi:hypothetical protein
MFFAYDAFRQILQGDPCHYKAYAAAWVALEPIGLALLCLATLEASGRVLRGHKAETAAYYLLCVLAGISLICGLAKLLEIQSKIFWVNTEIHNLTTWHQIAYAACCGLLAWAAASTGNVHCRRMAWLCGVEAVFMLAGNLRGIYGSLVPMALYVSTAGTSLMWARPASVTNQRLEKQRVSLDASISHNRR